MKREIVAIEHYHSVVDDIIKIEWHISRYCNRNCSYCTELTHDNVEHNLDLTKFKQGLQNLINNINDREISISFTGGEPTLNLKFINMLKYMSKFKLRRTSFTTNGSATLDYYKLCYKYISSITFSYHMEGKAIPLEFLIKLNKYIKTIKVNEVKKFLKVHIMFLPTTLERTKDLINNFKENGIRYVVRRIRPAYLKNHSYNEYWEDGSLKKGKYVEPFDTKSKTTLKFMNNKEPDFSTSALNYYSHEELDFLDKEEASNFEDTIIHYEDDSISTNLNNITKQQINQFKHWICWAGSQSLRIGVDGEIKPGSCIGISFGNVFEKFNLPSEPIRCPNNWCCSATNINTTKIKNNSYIDKVRTGKK